MENKDLIIGLFALIGLIVWIATAVINQRNVKALTQALTEAKSDDRLIAQLNGLATGVVPVEALYKGYDVMLKLAAFAKTLTPDDVDAAIDAGTNLAEKVIKPNAPDPAFVASIPIENQAVG
jgi:hypothetical protein